MTETNNCGVKLFFPCIHQFTKYPVFIQVFCIFELCNKHRRLAQWRGLIFNRNICCILSQLAFHITFFCNLVPLKKHSLRLVFLELLVLRKPALRQYFFRCVQSPKKFGWKFWILILQKSEKFGAEIWQKLFWKKYPEKYFSQNKIEKINAWKICSWKSSNWKKLLFIIEKNRTKLFEKQPKIFFENEIWKVLTF